MSRQETIWMSDDRGEQFDRVVEWLVVALLVFMPLAFGAVEAWSEQIVIILACAISMCFVMKALVTKSTHMRWTWAYVPLAVFILVVAVQLLPLPQDVAKVVSPNTALRKTQLLSDLPNAREVLSYMTISFYPYATKHDLRLVLAVACVFVVVLNVVRRPEQIMWLLRIIAAIGGGVALIALAQSIFGNGKIYWFIPTPNVRADSGPFVNHSHYAQFMNLSIGAALGVLLVQVRQRFLGRRTSPNSVAEYLSSPDARLIWALFAMIILGVSTVFLSMARGGIVSVLIASVFTTVVLGSRRSLKGANWIMVLLALGAFICILYTGFDAVYDRLATLGNLSRAEGGRWQIVKDTVVAWGKFPVFGTGLGTHEVVYPEFDRSMIPALASHAENEYVQTVEETGIAGFAALLAFGVLVGVHYFRVVRNSQVAIGAAAYGLGFGLVAVVVHSLSDFGQHLPANAMLTAIFCALLIRLSQIGADSDGRTDAALSGDERGRYYWITGLVVVGAIWAWGGLEANDARVAEGHWRKVLAAEQDLMGREWQGSNEEYTYLINHAERAVFCQAGNAKYRHWLNVYRWRAISHTIAPDTGEIVLPVEALDFAERIVGEFNGVRALCPTFGATWCVLGQLERSVLGRVAEGTRHIREGVKLAPCDCTARFVAGMLAVEEGDLKVAADHLAMAAQLDGRLYLEVASILVGQLDRSDLAFEIAGDSTRHLSVLTDILNVSSESDSATDEIRDKVMSVLEQKCQEVGAPSWALASLAQICVRKGLTIEAIAYYRRALAQEYGRIDWRLHLARLLEDAGALDDAIEEVRICLRLRPSHVAAKQLFEKLWADPRLAEHRGQLP